MAGAGQQYYDDSEAEEILRRAVASSPSVGGMSREGLLKAAEELGLSPEAVDRAAAELRQEREDRGLWKKFRLQQRSELGGHVGVYLAVNGGLILALGFHSWNWWVIGPWGLGVLSEVYKYASVHSAENEKAFTKWKRKRQRPDAPRITVHPTPILDEWFLTRPEAEKLEAIKYLRERTGLELKAAKAEVDACYERRGW